MTRSSVLRAGAAAAVSLFAAATSSATTIVVDYTHDTFFAANATAKATLDRAAADVSAVLTSTLGATSDTSTGSFGGSSLTGDFEWSFTNPSTGASQIYNPTVLPANEVRIFAGARTIAGSTLGQGGPGGFSAAFSGGITNQAEWSQAVANFNSAATANQGRGDGPVIYNLSGPIGGGSISAEYNFNVGSTIGHFWIDDDSPWHFDYSTPVAGGAFDLYSVAVHEILHAVGFGASESWDGWLADGDNDWLGPNVNALVSGDELVDGGSLAHIATGVMSRRLGDLTLQEAVMDPDIAPGQRKFITELDLAFLRDIGWDTVAVPEPASLGLFGVAASLLLCRRRR